VHGSGHCSRSYICHQSHTSTESTLFRLATLFAPNFHPSLILHLAKFSYILNCNKNSVLQLFMLQKYFRARLLYLHGRHIREKYVFEACNPFKIFKIADRYFSLLDFLNIFFLITIFQNI